MKIEAFSSPLPHIPFDFKGEAVRNKAFPYLYQ